MKLTVLRSHQLSIKGLMLPEVCGVNITALKTWESFKIFLNFFFFFCIAAAAAKSLQLCPTLCDPIDSSLPGAPIPGILQARTLEWVAISFSNAWNGKVKVKSLSRVQLFTTPWTAAYQGPLSMGFSRQEHWSRVPSPSPRTSLGGLMVRNPPADTEDVGLIPGGGRSHMPQGH